MALGGGVALLICRAANCLVGLPLDCVAETMRPQPVQPLRATAPFLLGAALIRGAIVPIVDAARLIGTEKGAAPGRFVTLKVDGRLVGFAFDSVVGIRAVPAVLHSNCPPLLANAAGDTIAAIAALDERLLFVLRGLRVIDPSVWEELAERGTTA